jgi:hypothetical protein
VIAPGQAAVAVFVGVEGEKPEVGQAGANQPVQLRWRAGDPGQEGCQLLFQLGSGRCLEVQALTTDGTGEHLHRSLIAQLTDPDGAQAIGPGGEQAPVPMVQRGQGEGGVQRAGGLQQHIQQALHLGAGSGLPVGQGKLQPACDRAAHLAGIQQLPFNGSRAQALAAQQGGDRLAIERGLERRQPAQQRLACSAGLQHQGIHNGAIPAEPGPVRLLPDPR